MASVRSNLIIAIEGGDGSGKATQAKLLAKYLRGKGMDVKEMSFPQYGKFSAIYIERYLNNEYGDAMQVPADLAGIPYAIDRYEATSSIKKHLLKDDSLVVIDRYVTSNMAHQGTKFTDTKDRRRYYQEAQQFEYEVLGIVRPTVNIILLVDHNTAQANVDKKSRRSYTDKKRDAHEADAEHLARATQNYREICQLYPEEFLAIECMKNGELRSIADVQEEIQKLIEKTIYSPVG